jgi:high-affinity Fe2+/Pb2+ permease
MKYREMVKIIQNQWRMILAIIFLVILIWMGYVWLVNGKWPDWTGFGEYIGPVVLPNQTFQPAKTLWDLMQLLIIPAILVSGAYWLNESARKREKEIEEKTRKQEIEIAEKRSETERKIASDNRQETALQTLP